ncbi:MAG: XRE family transcriptional regulator [Thermodesulfobacteriota bacterium]
MARTEKGDRNGSASSSLATSSASRDADAIKAALAEEIVRVIEAKRLSRVGAAKALGVGQARISNLINGRLEEVSIFRLLRHLMRLNHDVELRITPQKRRPGRLRVVRPSEN